MPATPPSPLFFVSVASKGLRNPVSRLLATLTGEFTSVDSKGSYVAPKLCKMRIDLNGCVSGAKTSRER